MRNTGVRKPRSLLPRLRPSANVLAPYTRLKIGQLSVPVLSANDSSPTSRARRILRYRLDIRVSPAPFQYIPCFRPILAPPARRVGRLWELCVVLAPLPNSTRLLSSTLPSRSRYSFNL